MDVSVLIFKAVSLLTPGVAFSVKNGVIEWPKNASVVQPSSAAIDAEIIRVKKQNIIDEHNSMLLKKMSDLDQRRIRPLAEGDTVFLAKLNAQIAALRIQLK